MVSFIPQADKENIHGMPPNESPAGGGTVWFIVFRWCPPAGECKALKLQRVYLKESSRGVVERYR